MSEKFKPDGALFSLAPSAGERAGVRGCSNGFKARRAAANAAHTSVVVLRLDKLFVVSPQPPSGF